MGIQPHILAVPFPVQGHAGPLMEFAHKLADHGFRVTFVNTESIHHKMLSTMLDHSVDEKDRTIHLVSIPDESIFSTAESFIEYLSDTMPGHVEKLIKKLNESGGNNIDCVVADGHVGSVLEVAERFGIKRAAFWPVPLGVLAFMLHFPVLQAAGDIDENGNPAKGEIVRLPSSMPAMTAVDLMWSFTDNTSVRMMTIAFIHLVNRAAKVASCFISNSFYELEPASHDSIPNILTVGPLMASEQLGHPNGQLWPEDSTCLAWLDQQPAQSVVYVAFGSTTVFDQGQFTGLVHGLELMNRPFLWVVRPGFSSELCASLLDSFKDRTAHYGKVVDWAPQKKVLAHSSIACFITHCGWNSALEGVSMGVPLLCWPYCADHFHNQNLICDIWKVGLRFSKDENGIITGSEIKTKVQELLADEGKRSRVNDLKHIAKRSVREGGSSSKHFQDIINMINC
nr:glycosyltransferase [Helleborus thibetanus]